MLGRDSYYTVIILQIYKYFIKTIYNIYFFSKLSLYLLQINPKKVLHGVSFVK